MSDGTMQADTARGKDLFTWTDPDLVLSGAWRDDPLPSAGHALLIIRLAREVNSWFESFDTLKEGDYEERVTNLYEFMLEHFSENEVGAFVLALSRIFGKSVSPFRHNEAFRAFANRHRSFIRGLI